METLIEPCLIYESTWSLESDNLFHFADIAPLVITRRVVPFTGSWLATVEHYTVLRLSRFSFIPVWVANSASVLPVKVPFSVKSNPNVRQCGKVTLEQTNETNKEIERAFP